MEDAFRVAVFCASKPEGTRKLRYLDLAHRFGVMLAESGFACVNGGNLGMMTELCRGAHTAGGVVHAICLDQEGRKMEHDCHTERESFSDLGERQHRLLQLGDAYVALPGGTGTLSKVTEVVASKGLGLYRGRLMICVGDLYAPLEMQYRMLVSEGLCSHDPFADGLIFVDHLEGALAILLQQRDQRLASK